MFRVKESQQSGEEDGEDIIFLFYNERLLCDLAIDPEAAKRFEDRLNSESVEPVHINDIIEDCFYS